MDVGRVMLLRELLASSGWVERTQSFARTMRRSTKDPGGLLLVGTPQAEPWHLAAHLDDEARLTGVGQLSPTLIRYAPPQDAPPHLSVTLQRLEQAKRGETVFVVSDEAAPASLLERAWDARKTGATVLSLDAGDDELHGVAHESLTVMTTAIEPIYASLDELALTEGNLASATNADGLPVAFDSVQHLVSVAAGEASIDTRKPSMRRRLARLLETISGPRDDSD